MKQVNSKIDNCSANAIYDAYNSFKDMCDKLILVSKKILKYEISIFADNGNYKNNSNNSKNKKQSNAKNHNQKLKHFNYIKFLERIITFRLSETNLSSTKLRLLNRIVYKSI